VRDLAELITPRRLGAGFRRLVTSSWVSNLGDGVALAAGPLLVASLTDDPGLVALAAAGRWIPQLLLSLPAGVLADRLDRRRMVVVADLVRTGMLAALAALLAAGAPPVGLVLAVLGLLSAAEVFADGASVTILPMIVDRDDLALANARLQTGFITVNQLVGPPIGAVLFAAGRIWPFVAQAVLVALGALIVSRVVLPRHGTAARRGDTGPPRSARHEIAEGFGWLLRNPAVRTLALTILVFNVTFGAAWSVLVLYVTRRLGLGGLGFGLVTTVIAAGGVVGTLGYGRLTRHAGLGTILRVGLVIETFTHLALAVTTVPWIAMVVFFVFGAHAFVWASTASAVRQRAVPSALQGRVSAAYQVAVTGGLVIGSGVGGVLAQRFGVTAPFWFAFAGSAVLLVLIWPSLIHIGHQDEAPRR
jgi:MFS family permease